MKCPFCGFKEDRVIDSRSTQDDASIRRRRECTQCGRRFTTYEYVEKIPLMVIKSDGRREPFNRQKIMDGLLRSCQKRPVSIGQLEVLVDEVEKEIQKKFDKETEAKLIGEMVMERLSQLDGVAYVRFASVYRQFKDVNEFMRELKDLLGDRSRKKVA
jgi:transcriptional repressor NrdR